MLYKPSSSHFSTLETIWLFLNLIKLKSPVDSVMSLFYHVCFPVTKSWGSEFFLKENIPFPLLNQQVVHSRLYFPLVLFLSSLFFFVLLVWSPFGEWIYYKWASRSYFFFHACFSSLPYFLSDNWGFWDCKELELEVSGVLLFTMLYSESLIFCLER